MMSGFEMINSGWETIVNLESGKMNPVRKKCRFLHPT